jgi:nucleoside-diphosphate-sugar epimerase
MRALVTGGAGFIGSNLCRGLASGGWAVTVLDDFVVGHRTNLAGIAVRLIDGDIRYPAAVDNAIEDCDVVFHLAASVGHKRSIDDPAGDSETNLVGAINVLEAARRAGVRKVALSSSAAVFGTPASLPVGEDQPAEPESPYGVSKLAAEKMGQVYTGLHGMEVISLRYFNVYGPRQRSDAYGNVVPVFVARILDGKAITIFGSGDQTRDFVHVDDVVQANLKAAAAQGVSGAFNIGSGVGTSVNALVALLRETMPETVESTHAEPRRFDIRDSLADIRAAGQALGYRPAVALRQGLEDYVRWVRRAREDGGSRSAA